MDGVRDLPRAALRIGRQRLLVARGRRRFQARPGPGAPEWIGSAYGSWPLPRGVLDADSVCYLAGLGEDASFDLVLIERFGCDVHAFDPVPEAVAYGTEVAATEPRFHFHPYGLWSEDATLVFHDNPQEGFVSRSATDMHGTGKGQQLAVRDLAALPAELGHDHIDLLKLSVEGSEYELLDVVIGAPFEVGVILVEFAQPAPLKVVGGQVDRLAAAGWDLVDIRIKPFNWKACFQAR